MNLIKLFENNDFLESELIFYRSKNQIKRTEKNSELVLSHIEKN